MIDILVYIFENYYDFSSHPKTETLARKLSSVGFEDNEISLALHWLSGLKEAPVADFVCHSRSTRVYSAEEQDKLGTECLGFVAFLESAKVISPPVRELVIEQGMLLDDAPISLSKFKIVVLMVLWSREQDLEPLIVEELLYDADREQSH